MAKRTVRKSAAKRAAAPRRVLKKASPKRSARPKKAAKKPAKAAKKAKASSARSSALFAPIAGADRREIGHVLLDVGRAGSARVKRMIYPAGFHWAADMKPVTGTDLCMHAHVGFLAHGEIHIEYADGCIVELRAPQVVAIDPGHDGWVVGKEPVVMIEFDFERDTVRKLGMPASHHHE
jgi:hypothetical protein